MAQYRHYVWQEDDSTFQMNWRELIISPHGLYAGFDAVLPHSMTMKLTMVNGVTKIKQDQTETDPMGCWRSKMGCIICEDADISLAINPTDGSGDRYDLIVGEHYHTETVGGTPALYKVIQGTVGAGIPALTIPAKQVILGILYLPPSTSFLDGSGVTYSKSLTPDYAGDSTVVHTNRIQEITHRKQIYHHHGRIAQMTLVTDGAGGFIATATVESNYYYIINVDSSYKLITGFDVPFSGNAVHFEIHSDQKLRIKTGGEIYVPETDFMHTELEEVIEVFDMSSLHGSPKYFVVRGNELRRDKIMKMFAGIIGNKQTASFASQEVTLNHRGNYYELALDYETINTAQGLARISGTLSYWNGVDEVTKGGNSVKLKLRHTGADPSSFRIRVDGGTGIYSTGMKPIRTLTGQPLIVTSAGITVLELIEDETEWLIVAMHCDSGWIYASNGGVDLPDMFDCVPSSVNNYSWRLTDNNTSIEMYFSVGIDTSGASVPEVRLRMPNPFYLMQLQWTDAMLNTQLRCGVNDLYNEDIQASFIHNLAGGPGYDPGIAFSQSGAADYALTSHTLNVYLKAQIRRLEY